ncbi:MAG: S9 family peptidase [Myxococcales bacterium]|nr:S9 family peptidase [Myxococcales bacterium]
MDDHARISRPTALLLSLLLVVLGAAGCSSGKSSKTKSTKGSTKKGQAGGASHRGPGRPAGQAPVDPPTASPSSDKRDVLRVAYDAAKDPANKAKGGFDFTDKRAPDAPADRRKRPFDIEALYKVASVSSPAFSPDGKWLLFTVTRYALAKGKSNTDIYRVRPDGSELRRLTHHESSDSSPVWAPDGRSFVFVSGRKDGAQLWRMHVDGGEPKKISDIKTGVSHPRFTPDGKSLLFVSRVFPELGADQAKNKALVDDIKKSPIKAHLADELLYRHWTFYKDGRRSHILRLELATNKLTDLTPGDFDTPAFGQGDAGFDISPDGAELCFVSNREPGSARAWTTNKDLFVVSLRGAPNRNPRNLTKANKAFDGHPRYSPDGKHIAFVTQKIPGYESDRLRLAVYDRKAGSTRVLSEGFDNWVMDFQWSYDNAALIFKGAEKGRFPLFRLNVTSGKIERLAVPPSVRSFDVAKDGRVAFTFTSVGRPAELFISDVMASQAKRLTFINREVVERYDLRPVEEMWIEVGGRKVHTFIVKPHGFVKGRRYPLIINVHGGPQYQWTDRMRGDWQVYPSAGYVVAFFNPTGSIGYGQQLTYAISKDWGGAVYRDVMAVTDALAKLPFVDAKKLGAMGWSYGGYMMAWLLGNTTRFRAIAAMMAVYDLPSFHGATEELWFPEWDLGGVPWNNAAAYSKFNPSSLAAKFKTPTLVITGERDYRVPYTQSLQLFTALRRQNVPARLIVFPNDGHWPSWVKSMPLYYAAHLDWFARYLGGKKSPYDLKAMIRGRAFNKKKK